jgi:hypothetical protein
MLGRGGCLILAVAVLAATGVAAPAPCCALEELSRPVPAGVPDCCDRPDCCRVEKRGPAQAALSSKAPEVGATAIAAVGLLQWHAQTIFYRAAEASSRPLFAKDHPPPPHAGRDTHLRISLLRL